MTRTQEEKALILRIKEGDAGAFEELFGTHCRALIRFAVRLDGENETAEGIVQDVFVRIWHGRTRLNPDLSLKAYLYQAVKNQSLQHLRHLKIVNRDPRQQETVPEAPHSPEAEVVLQEVARAVYDAVSELPPHRRMIFTLSKYDHYTYAEIAEIQEISIKTVETQMGRALKYLRKRLAHLLGFLLVFLSGYLSAMGL